MRRSWLKFGISALLAVLMVGGIFSGSVSALSHKQSYSLKKYKVAHSLYEWLDYYYKNPGKHYIDISGNQININVKRAGKTAYINMKYINKAEKKLIIHITIIPISDAVYEVKRNGHRYFVSSFDSDLSKSVILSSDPSNVLSLDYYIGSNGIYGGSESSSQCLGIQKWNATGMTNTYTDTGRVDWSGPSIFLYQCWVPMGLLNVGIKISDSKGFQLNSGSFKSSGQLLYPYINTNTWKSVTVTWEYFAIIP